MHRCPARQPGSPHGRAGRSRRDQIIASALPFKQEPFQQESHHRRLALRRWTNRDFAARSLQDHHDRTGRAGVENPSRREPSEIAGAGRVAPMIPVWSAGTRPASPTCFEKRMSQSVSQVRPAYPTSAIRGTPRAYGGGVLARSKQFRSVRLKARRPARRSRRVPAWRLRSTPAILAGHDRLKIGGRYFIQLHVIGKKPGGDRRIHGIDHASRAEKIRSSVRRQAVAPNGGDPVDVVLRTFPDVKARAGERAGRGALNPECILGGGPGSTATALGVPRAWPDGPAEPQSRRIPAY